MPNILEQMKVVEAERNRMHDMYCKDQHAGDFHRPFENYCAGYQAAVRELGQDKERLDHVEANPVKRLVKQHKRWSFVGLTTYEFPVFKTAREAIDASMRGET